MKDIISEMPVADIVERYPAAKMVLSRYGFDAYEEADPLRESVSRFAESRGIPGGRLLEELKEVVEVSEQNPAPSSFLSLLETHEWLDEMFLLHQEALVAQDLPLALELLEKVDEGQREHIRVEEEILLPVYERAGEIPGGTRSSTSTSTGKCSRSSTASRRVCLASSRKVRVRGAGRS